VSASPDGGLRRGLTHYGDPDFALYLRRSFARSMGSGEATLERPAVSHSRFRPAMHPPVRGWNLNRRVN
jgi:hypothetical protein